MRGRGIGRWSVRRDGEPAWLPLHAGRAGRRREALLLFSVTGMLAGIALPEAIRMGTGSYAGLFSLYSFQQFRQTEFSPWQLFPLVAVIRLRTLLFLWMSSYTPAGFFFHGLWLWWLSCSGGMLLSLFALRDGYEGVLLFFCCLFPQWILYGAAWRRELSFFLDRRGGMQPEEGMILPGLWPKDLRKLVRMAGLTIAGAGAEAFVGMWTIKLFLQFFT